MRKGRIAVKDKEVWEKLYSDISKLELPPISDEVRQAMREIREHGSFKLQYRLLINGRLRPVTLKLALFKENGEQKIVVGVRAWKERRGDAGRRDARWSEE